MTFQMDHVPVYFTFYFTMDLPQSSLIVVIFYTVEYLMSTPVILKKIESDMEQESLINSDTSERSFIFCTQMLTIALSEVKCYFVYSECSKVYSYDICILLQL